MGVGASVLVIALLFVSHLLDVLTLRAFVNAALLILACVFVFYAAFRSGMNLRFRDPSLTVLQILCSSLVILYVLYESESGHGVLTLIYMVSFLFGVFRLDTRQLLSLTVFVALSYALIIVLQWHPGADLDEFKRKLLNWIVLTAVLTFFSIMGGYLSRLRKQLAESKVRLEEALRRIEHLAARDELTGVFNRRSLVDVMTQQKSRADRYGTTFSVLIADIDFFKRVNDTHGHQAGDAVLKKFAEAAAACLRSTDVFGRYGGEEFLAVLDQTSLAGVPVVAERLCAAARQLNLDEVARGFRVSVSAGGAEYIRPEDWKATVARADQALYRAKEGGRDRFELNIAQS